VTVELADLGDWGTATLVAEYDPAADVIRVDARAVNVVRRELGEAEARRFVRVAVAHEAYHRADPHATEAQAHAAAQAAGGGDPRAYEAVLRAARHAERA